MIDKLQQQLAKAASLRQNRGRWLVILAVMAALVAAATAYALVRPAITLESPTYCGREEHTHTAACYTGIATGETAATPETAACGKEEHTHTLACYADPRADVEDAALWAQSVAQAELTGDWPHDAAAVAQTQLSYTASEKNYTVDADGETKHPYTRYGAWGGDAYADWNLPFVNFCLHYAGVPTDSFPQADTLAALLQWLTDDPARYAAADGYTPQPGDVALLAENGTDVSAVGIVAELCPATDDEAAKVAVIEADASGTVRRVEYAQGDAQLAGYAILPQNPDYTPAAAETAEPEATATPEPVATAMLAPEFDEQAEETNDIAVYADDATEEKTITSITAEPKSGEPIPAGKKLTLDMFTVTVYYSDGTSAVLPDPVTVTSPNWPNNYPSNMTEKDNSRTTTFPGVKSLNVTFDAASKTENSYDKIYLYDKSSTLKETLSGTAMAGKTYTIPGDMVKIAMSSNSGGTYKGFSAAVTAGIQLSLKRVPRENGDFTVSLTLLDESGNPTEISTTVELTAVADNNKGICGDNAQWSYDDSDGTLTITGTGATYNYATEEPAPWNELDVQKLVVMEGITGIGERNFVNCENLKSVTIQADLDVNNKAFSGCTAIEELNVTGTAQKMKTEPRVIVKDCVGGLKLVLAKGITLPSDALKGCTGLKTIKIEGNLTTIPEYGFYNCPELMRVELPDTVKRIEFSAFYSCSSLENNNIPDGITFIGTFAFGSCDSFTHVEIPDSVESIGNFAFSSCKALQTISFGAESNLKKIGNYAFERTPLKELEIPQNVEELGYGIVRNCADLSEIKWNAGNAVWEEEAGVYTDVYKDKKRLTITVGKTVEALPARTMQAFVTCGATEVHFAGRNWLTIENAGQMGNFMPLGNLPEGQYYADEQGALYRLEDARAVLAYVPDGITNYTVPETVPADAAETSTLPVTAVGGNALHCASDLESLTFAKPEQITELADCAFAYAGNLSAINRETTASAVLSQFVESCKKGSLLFVGTKIKDDAAQLVKELHFSGLQDSGQNPTLEVTVRTTESTNCKPAVAEDGTQFYYTGETAITTVTISNPQSAQIGEDDGAVVRLYMDFDDKGGAPSLEVGEYSIDGSSQRKYTLTVTKISGINRYCFEIQRPLNGDTISLDLGSIYVSPKTSGGTNRIFGTILTAKEKETLQRDELPAIDQYLNLQWKTQVDKFPVTKERVTQTVSMTGDGEGGAYIKGLAYYITMNREDDTLEGMGKDLMTSVEFTDTLTLPEEITLSENVLEAIKTNSYHWGNPWGASIPAYTPDGTEILRIETRSMNNYRLAINDAGNLVIYWTVRNNSIPNDYPTEMSNLPIKVIFGDKTLYLAQPEADKTYKIDNAVKAVEHFSYSADQTSADDCSYTLQAGEGSLVVGKGLKGAYTNSMGDRRTYVITASNPSALPYEALAFLDDEMPEELYLSADDIVDLFQKDQERQASVTINNATICELPEETEVKDMNGALAGKVTVGNTSPDTDNKYNGMSKGADPTERTDKAQITISWSKDEGSPNRLVFALSDVNRKVDAKTESCKLDATAIQNLLDDWGYLVTHDVRYTVRWDLRDVDGNFSLKGGQELSYELQVTNKDSFMMVATDQKWRYPSNTLTINNYAFGRNVNGSNLGNDYTVERISREFWLVKDATIDGQEIPENSDLLQNGAIIDYSLTVDHTGTASYDLLPLTDHMSGAQVLLAEVEPNKDADWAKRLEPFPASDGTEYYKLEAAGTYEGVWLDGHYADSVKVTKTSAGRDTLIKWYFSNYEGGVRTDTICYKALLQLTGQASGIYPINNECWLGDHQNHRIYNVVGWKRLDYTFEKKIVDSVDDTGEGTDYRQIAEGQTVIYRLKLQTIQQGTYTLNGLNLYDALPKSLGAKGFTWTKGTDDAPGTVDIVKYECEGSSTITNKDNWFIETDNHDASRQYIKWGNDVNFTISEKPLYIYVRLTFPKDAEWQEYAKQYGTVTLENTFYVEGVPDTVTHDLQLPAKAYLQKGVWSTFSTAGTEREQYIIDNPNSTGRLYYCNDDLLTRFVFYYVVLRNDGQTRLYLNDMQDTLPEGFTLYSMSTSSFSYFSGGDYNRNMECVSNDANSNYYVSTKHDGTYISYRTGTVNASVDENDPTKLTFHFSQASSDKYPVRYDAQRDKCYLNPGEAIQFGYFCRTNNSEDTGNEATNTVTMPYYDYNGGGLVRGDGKQEVMNSNKYTPNDGDCNIWDNRTAALNDFTLNRDDLYVDKDATQWLESDVTVRRGGIAPGITKKLAAKIDQKGNVTNKPLSAAPTDTLRWNVIAQNNGTLPIIDYTLSDTMPAPYEFTGWVNYRIKTSASATGYVAQINVFKIDETDKEGIYKITYYKGDGNSAHQNEATLQVNDDPLTISLWFYANNGNGYQYYNDATADIRLTRDAETQATTLWVHFSDPCMCLPEGGVATLTLDTKQDASWRNTVYTNSCNITPMVQPWDTNAVNQGNATTQTPPFGDKPQERSSVRNSAPVTVAFGYTTSSQKSVEQVGNATNKATSDDTKNYIVLPDAGAEFRYNLEVRNADPTNVNQMHSMDELILIDSLPQPGDHTVFQPDDPRYSAFKVSLAEKYDPVVTITDKEDKVTTLNKDQYTLEFSEKTTFTGDDWDGTSEWSDSPTNARSLRLKLREPQTDPSQEEALMPSGCKIALSFTCKVDDPKAAAGQIAWNSFGYHYKMNGASSSQEAAPLKVGVMLPTRPTLQKKLQRSGAPYAAEQNETFTFYCYTGLPLTNLPDNWTADDLKKALTADGRKYQEITLTVPEGATQSDMLTLTPTDERTWTKGATYTLVEVPTDNYTLATLGGLRQSSYTFTYDPAKATAITAVNDHVTWNFTIEKVDADAQDTRLADAWFALYSPDERDAMTDDAYNALPYKPDRQVTVGGQTWYLTQVDATKAESGFLTFSGLLREKYSYKEFRAPNGYTLDDTLCTITRTADSTKFCTVTNKSGYVLPKTGGCGTTPFTAAGLLLTAAAACLLYRQYKRRRGKTTRTE